MYCNALQHAVMACARTSSLLPSLKHRAHLPPTLVQATQTRTLYVLIYVLVHSCISVQPRARCYVTLSCYIIITFKRYIRHVDINHPINQFINFYFRQHWTVVLVHCSQLQLRQQIAPLFNQNGILQQAFEFSTKLILCKIR